MPNPSFPKTLNEKTWRLLSKSICWCFNSQWFSGIWTWGCVALTLHCARQQRAGLRLSLVSVQVICCCHSIRKLTKSSCKAVLPRPAQGAWAPHWGLPVTPAPPPEIRSWACPRMLVSPSCIAIYLIRCEWESFIIQGCYSAQEGNGSRQVAAYNSN